MDSLADVYADATEVVGRLRAAREFCSVQAAATGCSVDREASRESCISGGDVHFADLLRTMQLEHDLVTTRTALSQTLSQTAGLLADVEVRLHGVLERVIRQLQAESVKGALDTLKGLQDSREPSGMVAIERDNPRLKGVLPKDYARPALDKQRLGELIDLIATIELTAASEGEPTHRSVDLLGRVYEYFLTRFASAEGKNGGQFYTPSCVVRCLVEMLEPYGGKVFDPCCGSGGMFVQSEKFVSHHQGRLDDISIYGQESNETTYKLCRMNLAIRGIDGSNIKWNPEGSFLNDAHKDLKADFVIANPPFNDSDWGGDLLRQDGRWQYGTPPVGNANFAWVQHFLYHLSPTGAAGFVLSNGSLSSNSSGEGEIRKSLVQQDLVDCIVMLPTQLFYNTGIPACLWFLSRYKNGNKHRNRKGEVLFIDASELGYMVNRRNRAFAEADIQQIAGTYHEWKRQPSPPAPLPGGEGSQNADTSLSGELCGEMGYRDIKGFCKSATLADIEKHNFVLTPGRYVGIPDEEDDGVPFEETMASLTAELAAQMQEAQALDEEIKIQLAKVGFEL